MAGLVAAPAGGFITFHHTFHVVPTGGKTTGTTCPTTDPCDLRYAVETLAKNGDTVFVHRGSVAYILSRSLTIDKAIRLVGEPGPGRPNISSSASITARGGVNISHLSIAGSSVPALTLTQGAGPSNSVLEDSIVQASFQAGFTTGQPTAVSVGDGWLIRNSVISAPLQFGIALQQVGGASDLRNVTAVATGNNSTALQVKQQCGSPVGPAAVVTAKNTILIGDGHDAILVGCSTGGATAKLSFSNFRSGAVSTSGTGGVVDEGGNQAGPPLFASRPNGDFHEISGSPTINAGTTDSLMGTTDFDGDARSHGNPDIGADEFIPIPNVFTGPPSLVGTVSARVSGRVTPNGLPTTYHFEFGTSTAYGRATPSRSAGAGTAAVNVEELLTGLPSTRTIHYRLVASNSEGTRKGFDRVFKTQGPSARDDSLNGTGLADRICGLAGDDTINGFAGNDTLFGDECSKVSATASNDGDDRLFGGNGNDRLIGSGGNDLLDGGGGNDSLTGGPGHNTYKGGPGNDTVSARNKTKDTVDCGRGKDTATVDKTDKVKNCEKVKRA